MGDFITKTASLKATKALIYNLDVKRIHVDGKEVATSVKHPNDTREIITENDLWGSWAEIKGGEIIFHNDTFDNPNIDVPNIELELPMSNWNTLITKIEDNKAYIGDTLFANIETNNLKNGTSLLFFSNIEKISDDFNSLESFMFGAYLALNLKEVTINAPKLRNGMYGFASTPLLEEFICDTKSLTNGFLMFGECINLSSFTGNLCSLICGGDMFYGCKLDLDSLTHIADSIRDLKNNPPSDDELNLMIEDVKMILGPDENIPSDDFLLTLGMGQLTLKLDTSLTKNAKNFSELPKEVADLLIEINNKGWMVITNTGLVPPQENTNQTSIDDEESNSPIPYYAKPIRAPKLLAKYIGEDGNYYNIQGGNFMLVNDIETYGLFTSEEDAAANMRLTKIK